MRHTVLKKRQCMKKGDRVYACYDGKWGRRMPGVVIGVRASQIKVQFEEYAENNVIESWFYRRNRNEDYYNGYVKVVDSLMEKLYGLPGDYYAILSKEHVDANT